MTYLITSYEDPDMDGVACTYAYAELLKSQGQDAVAAVFGTPHVEAQHVMKLLNVQLPDGAQYLDRDIILVDASNPNNLAAAVKPERVVEIIDHRKSHEAWLFPNAKPQIEMVGAAATLVAERFGQAPISRESAALLYAAIISNTVNFKTKTTTERDHVQAKLLLQKAQLPDSFIRDMFHAKSAFTIPIHDMLASDTALCEANGFRMGAVQLEIIGVKEFVAKNEQEIKDALRGIMKENAFDSIYLGIVDIELGRNFIIVIDEKGEEVLGQALQVSFTNGIATIEQLVMRKEINPKVKEVLNK